VYVILAPRLVWFVEMFVLSFLSWSLLFMRIKIHGPLSAVYLYFAFKGPVLSAACIVYRAGCLQLHLALSLIFPFSLQQQQKKSATCAATGCKTL
jgi:hypothetical protein